ncbi:MAG: cobalamin-dependent protein [Lentisphaerae bacterium]|nr:cobalamin-dependent protein [Lentisphaerota bacterium]
MKILLVNPPNSGRDVAFEKFGLNSGESIFRGEPLCLETIAGPLDSHDVMILDLKVAGEDLDATLSRFQPEVVGLTAVTCEANTVIRLCEHIKQHSQSIQVVVGGMHASNDPEFFNRPNIDYIVIGLGKASFKQLIDRLDTGRPVDDIPGVAVCHAGSNLQIKVRSYCKEDLVEDAAPRYDLVSHYRNHYFIPSLKVSMGFIATAFGCPYSCTFCCIGAVTGRRYITHTIKNVIRDIALLDDSPLIRLVDANTFGDIKRARLLSDEIRRAQIKKQFIVDACVETIVKAPDLFKEWRDIGMRGVVIGFEEIDNDILAGWQKKNTLDTIKKSIDILKNLGISIIGDFVVSPSYSERDFLKLGEFLRRSNIDVPVIAVLTPLPGTRLHESVRSKIVNHDLDYYSFANAVMPTHMPERDFYEHLIALRRDANEHSKL